MEQGEAVFKEVEAMPDEVPDEVAGWSTGAVVPAGRNDDRYWRGCLAFRQSPRKYDILIYLLYRYIDINVDPYNMIYSTYYIDLYRYECRCQQLYGGYSDVSRSGA